MALIKRVLGNTKYTWCIFLKKNFSLTDKLCTTIYDKYLKDKIEENIVMETPSTEQNHLWINEVKKGLEDLINTTRGFGLQAYFRLLHGFDMPVISKLTMVLITKDFLKNNTQGSTILNFKEYIEYVKGVLEGYEDTYNTKLPTVDAKLILNYSKTEEILLMGKSYNVLKEDTDIEDIYYITTREAYMCEKFLYNYLSNKSREKLDLITDEIIEEVLSSADYQPNEQQLNFLMNFRKSGFNILNGLGGTGKTFSMKLAINMLEKAGYNVLLLAPTGISAQVLKNNTSRRASTIHRWYYSNGDLEDINVLILDECSMLGLDHWLMLCHKLREVGDIKPMIFMIGDTGQLQPISSGAFFRDFIDLVKAKVIKGNIISLEKVMRAREDSFISHFSNYFALNSKEVLPDTLYENREKRVYMIPLDETLDNAEEITDFVDAYMRNMEFSWEETSFIIPQRVGNKGTKIFNELILKKLRKREPNIKPLGMVIANNYGLGVFNGQKFRLESQTLIGDYKEVKDKETGKMKDISSYEYVVTMLDDEREVVFTTGEVDWEISYANTVHKLQGCTVKNVIFLCSKTHTFMLTKQLVYTGLSRASDTITCLYDKYTLERSRYKDTKYNRVTFLGETVKKYTNNKRGA